MLSTYILEIIIGLTWVELSFLTLICGGMGGLIMAHLKFAAIGASGILFSYWTITGALFLLNFGALKKHPLIYILFIDMISNVMRDVALLGHDHTVSHEGHIVGAAVGLIASFALELRNNQESSGRKKIRKIYKTCLICSYFILLIVFFCREN